MRATAKDFTLLFVESGLLGASLIQDCLRELHPTLHHAGSLEEAHTALRNVDPQLLLIDLGREDELRAEAVQFIRDLHGDVPVIVISGSEDEATALDCLQAGAADCYFKSDISCLEHGVALALRRRHGSPQHMCSIAREEGAKVVAAEVFPILEAVDHGLRRLRENVRAEDAGRQVQQLRAKLIRLSSVLGAHLSGVGDQWLADWESDVVHRHGILTRCANMNRAVETCIRVAPTQASVLLLGETGTGKELVARAIHAESGRQGQFVAVNCGAVPEQLIESELFGHCKGAFTGAHAARPGLFQIAEGGTLFLDEVGNMPLSCQVSTLRALQERKIRPVGGSEEVPVDLRIVAATSGPLDEAASRGEFRPDLLYRLDVVRVELPPLRERRGDVEILIRHYAPRLAEQHGVPVPEFRPGFFVAAREFSWPGNVRQLANLVERLLLTSDGPFTEQDLVRALGSTRLLQQSLTKTVQEEEQPQSPKNLERAISDAERSYLRQLLKRHDGRLQEVATTAGVSSRTVLRRLKKYGLHHSGESR